MRSQFATDLPCQYCGQNDSATQWPTSGDDLSFYYATDPQRFQVPIACGHCKRIWFVVWDEDPGEIRQLKSPRLMPDQCNCRTCRSSFIQQFTGVYNEQKLKKKLWLRKSLASKQCKNGWTPLHHVAAANSVDSFAKFLFEYGANPNATLPDGKTPLHLTAMKGAYSSGGIAYVLLMEGANIDATDSSGTTPGEYAVEQKDQRVAKAIADFEKNGESYKFLYAAHVGDKKTIEAMLQTNPSVLESAKDNCRALHIAAANGFFEIVNLLLRKDASVNELVDYSGAIVPGVFTSPMCEGRTPLDYAIASGHNDIADAISQAGGLRYDDLKAPPTVFECPSCSTKFDISEYAGKTFLCECGTQVSIPCEQWLGEIENPYLSDDIRSIRGLPAENLEEAVAFISFLTDVLPRQPRQVIEAHYRPHRLLSPVGFTSSIEAAQHLVEHINDRIQGRNTKVYVELSSEQCSVSSKHDYIHYVAVQVVPENDNQPRYSVYQLGDGKLLLERPTW